MNASNPPRLAMALLRRFVHDNEPLVGDLLEAFALRQSRWWFWQQTLLAILFRTRPPHDDGRPLVLVERDMFERGELRAATRSIRSVNLTGSPVPGIGGLGLLALAVLVTVVRPQAWWILLAAVGGGVVLGVTMVIVRRRRALSSDLPPDVNSRST